MRNPEHCRKAGRDMVCIGLTLLRGKRGKRGKVSLWLHPRHGRNYGDTFSRNRAPAFSPATPWISAFRAYGAYRAARDEVYPLL
jgi:hypothetical protein